MSIEYTPRGFRLNKFKDRNGVLCSIQESSIATEACIWIGCNEIGLKRFEPYIGWSDVKLHETPPDGILYTANTRMHLTQEMVKEILPTLQHFAETGELPRESSDEI